MGEKELVGIYCPRSLIRASTPYIVNSFNCQKIQPNDYHVSNEVDDRFSDSH
jgi:hypothetical protein